MSIDLSKIKKGWLIDLHKEDIAGDVLTFEAETEGNKEYSTAFVYLSIDDVIKEIASIKKAWVSKNSCYAAEVDLSNVTNCLVVKDNRLYLKTNKTIKLKILNKKDLTNYYKNNKNVELGNESLQDVIYASDTFESSESMVDISITDLLQDIQHISNIIDRELSYEQYSYEDMDDETLPAPTIGDKIFDFILRMITKIVEFIKTIFSKELFLKRKLKKYIKNADKFNYSFKINTYDVSEVNVKLKSLTNFVKTNENKLPFPIALISILNAGLNPGSEYKAEINEIKDREKEFVKLASALKNTVTNSTKDYVFTNSKQFVSYINEVLSFCDMAHEYNKQIHYCCSRATAKFNQFRSRIKINMKIMNIKTSGKKEQHQEIVNIFKSVKKDYLDTAFHITSGLQQILTSIDKRISVLATKAIEIDNPHKDAIDTEVINK